MFAGLRNPLRLGKQIAAAAFCLCFSAGLFAAQLTGTVTNGTTGKPSVGDDVTLLSLASGMEEVAHSKTDSQGRYSLELADQSVPHLVRVGRQGVYYFRAAPPGTTSADVTVYDAAKTVDNIIGEGRVFRFQTVGGQLEVSEMYILRNESKPPRTKMSDRTFEVTLPEGAVVEDGMTAGPGGMPVSNSPLPTGKKNHYAFVFPIRPGRTQFQVTYKLPYNGSHDFSVSPDMPLAELGIMLPKSMKFTSGNENFAPAQDEAGMTVFVAKSLSPGQLMKFSVSGEGAAPREGQDNAAAAGAEAARPGGGLGAPIQAPGPLDKSRWYIIGGFVVVLAAGAYFLIRKQGPASARPAPANASPRSASTQRAQQHSSAVSAHAPSSNGNMLDAIKEELFQLETERLQGNISQQDYQTSKAGLETLLRRQLKKAGDPRKK